MLGKSERFDGDRLESRRRAKDFCQLILFNDNVFDQRRLDIDLGFLTRWPLWTEAWRRDSIAVCSIGNTDFPIRPWRRFRHILDSAFVRCTYTLSVGLKRGMFVSVDLDPVFDSAFLYVRGVRLHRISLSRT